MSPTKTNKKRSQLLQTHHVREPIDLPCESLNCRKCFWYISLHTLRFLFHGYPSWSAHHLVHQLSVACCLLHRSPPLDPFVRRLALSLSAACSVCSSACSVSMRESDNEMKSKKRSAYTYLYRYQSRSIECHVVELRGLKTNILILLQNEYGSAPPPPRRNEEHEGVSYQHVVGFHVAYAVSGPKITSRSRAQ